ncbi:MAG: twin-arginine translocation signal domain-containing protein [Aureliella sp.]
MATHNRRRFVKRSTATVAGLAGVAGLPAGPWQNLPALRAEDVQLDSKAVRFRDEIEPLVRLIEDTPRGDLTDKILHEIKNGRSYRELLAAMFLAGIRNVQPRPAVGFKFHCVLVVYATHQASMAAADRERWLPLLWAIDNFKGAQAADVREGNWTMAKVDESRLPPPEKALSALQEALEAWDVEAADAAAAAAARTASKEELLDVLARYATRDFRSIGHKAIYVAAAFRALDVIGWEHTEPIVRSLAYAILNHQGDDNPSKHDYEADRAGRENWQLVQQWTAPWDAGKLDSTVSQRTLEMLRTAEPVPAAKETLEMLKSGAHPNTISDGVALAAAELVMRQPGIVPLHAITSTNAIHNLAQHVGDEKLRKWLLLQNVSFLGHFADAAKGRGKLGQAEIDSLQAAEGSAPSIDEVFATMSSDRKGAASAIYRLAQDPANAQEIVRVARHFIFLKGDDAHDYKFSSAALEDFEMIHPQWRANYLAGCSHLFRAAGDKSNALAERVLNA